MFGSWQLNFLLKRCRVNVKNDSLRFWQRGSVRALEEREQNPYHSKRQQCSNYRTFERSLALDNPWTMFMTVEGREEGQFSRSLSNWPLLQRINRCFPFPHKDRVACKILEVWGHCFLGIQLSTVIVLVPSFRKPSFFHLLQ